MSGTWIAANVVSYEPERDPGKISPDRLRVGNWPEKLVQIVERNQAESSKQTQTETESLTEGK